MSSSVPLVVEQRVGLLETRGTVSSTVPLFVEQRVGLLETRGVVSSTVPLAVAKRIGLLVLCRVLCLWLSYIGLGT